MQAGKVLVAEHEGAYVLKLVGDVRLTLCASLDDFIERMFSNPKFSSVLIDLTETDGADSTTLGVLAKLSIRAQQQFHFQPVIFSTNPDITRIMESMGFTEIFDIQNKAPGDIDDLGELPLKNETEDEMRRKIIDAHRVLMNLSAENELRFTELINTLESSHAPKH